MAKIVYTDHERAAPYVKWHGVEFVHGQETPVDEREHGNLIRAAKDNPWFKVIGDGGSPAAGPTAKATARGKA
ncbi:hypothetical protein SAMN05444161_1655 [Rhizobiales bacterium GAS191]|jgi:hypothetical protein|nr:hypothetical protein SAMN05519103_00761 [Rhizobiales bacterium GAS113]SEC69915.1 hypothetical protein SAMN05444161_1655 [Rhizobiales bacterium GAS191]